MGSGERGRGFFRHEGGYSAIVLLCWGLASSGTLRKRQRVFIDAGEKKMLLLEEGMLMRYFLYRLIFLIANLTFILSVGDCI